MLHKFSSLMEEGSAYKFVYFTVIPNTGHYRATFHEFKLIFMFKTTVLKKESELLPMSGFTFAPFNEVLTYDDTYDYLIDVI
ncbi:DUF223 domain-containing protein, partial [Escherichia coli]|nr:DUF223 domain-containing protein [Escherichia coli]